MAVGLARQRERAAKVAHCRPGTGRPLSVRGGGRPMRPWVGQREGVATRDCVQFQGALVDSADMPAIPGQGPFVRQIRLAVVAEAAGGDGEGVGPGEVFQELPSKQDIPLLQHEVPVLAVPKPMM